MSEHTGGPAFPQIQEWTPDGEGIFKVSGGMTLRDWFAGQAIGQLIIMERRQPEHDFTTVQGRIDWYASESYRVADAMLKAREK